MSVGLVHSCHYLLYLLFYLLLLLIIINNITNSVCLLITLIFLLTHLFLTHHLLLFLLNPSKTAGSLLQTALPIGHILELSVKESWPIRAKSWS